MTMKEIIATVLCFVLTLSFVGCGNSAKAKVKIDYGTSST